MFYKTCFLFIAEGDVDDANADECAENNGGCQRGCVNIASGFMCTCPDGFTLSANNIDCQGTFIKIKR